MSSAANQVCAEDLIREIYLGFGVGAVGDVEGFAGGVGDGVEVFDPPAAVGGAAVGGVSPPIPEEGVGFTGVTSGAGAAIFELVVGVCNSPAPELGAAFGRFANSSVSALAPVLRA
jgi:hypothetical protein